VTVVERTFTEENEASDKIELSYWLGTAGQKLTICVLDTDLATGGPGGAAITNPVVLGLTKIRGLVMENDINVDLRFDSEASQVLAAEGHVTFSDTDLDIVEITRNDAVGGQIKIVVWGDR
jgi:hypothetical protein